jgi:hypothetical protein
MALYNEGGSIRHFAAALGRDNWFLFETGRASDGRPKLSSGTDRQGWNARRNPDDRRTGKHFDTWSHQDELRYDALSGHGHTSGDGARASKPFTGSQDRRPAGGRRS